MADRGDLASDSRGNYRRDLGWKSQDDGRHIQQCFYLGTNRAEAHRRVERLERLWEAVESRHRRLTQEGKTDDPRPFWDNFSLRIGLAIARGDETCTIDPSTLPGGDVAEQSPGFVAYWFAEAGQDFGGCGIRLVLSERVEKVRQEGVQQRAKQGRTTGNGQTLYQALDAYAGWIGKTKLLLDGSGQMSPTAVLHRRQVQQI